MDVLALLGYALNLDHDMRSGEAISQDATYEYQVERGPVVVNGREGPMVFSGRELRAIAQFAFEDPAVLSAAGRLLRQLIAWHLDGKELQSRKVLREMRSGSVDKGQVTG